MTWPYKFTLTILGESWDSHATGISENIVKELPFGLDDPNKLGHIRDHKIHTPQELKQIPLSNYWFPRHRINLFGWHDIQIKHRHFKRSWDRTLWEKWIRENSAKLFFFKWFSLEKLTFLVTINTFSETLRKARQLLMSLQKIDGSELYNNIIDKVTIIVSEVRKMAVTCKFRTHVQSYHNEMTD